jgi:hypothetical protein
MVAKINTPHRLLTALNYNEKKVQNGKAECIYAGNYLQEANKINFYQKLERFENLNKLNDRATTKTIHISLNFDPKENVLKEKLTQIASEYMNKIGFGEQPYLVYQHHDAGHPHIHIVATTIQADGSRINTHNIGRNQSEKARKEIEQTFKLVKAENQKRSLQSLKPIDVIKVVYGKAETKRGISHVVTTVMNSYRFTSLPEFNASLKQFNVIADRGNEDGMIYKTGGLIYRMLDESGNKIGVPIKASSIYSKPTLANLEKKFAFNETAREPFKQKIKNAIDAAFETSPNDLKQFIGELKNKQVYTLLRQNTEGRIYGITFVDNKNKCVFNGSDLGKDYSISALQNKFAGVVKQDQKSNVFVEAEKPVNSLSVAQINILVHKDKKQSANSEKNESLLNQLLSVKEQNENVPFQFRKKKRKRKNRNLGL